MAQEVGIAYVTVAPSAKGFGKAVEGEIDKGVDGASKSAGGRLRSLAGTVVKWGTAAVVGVGAAITGLALKGGISRALNIEDAQAKLRGLGHDTKSVEAIMTDALAAVRGTAFGLDTAATVAATAVAAGIKPGQELEKYLRLTADAATIAGVSMEEMGSILNKATTAGKVYTQELNQLADRGLPIFQWLQEEYGVTAEELRKMVAAGEVDAETFRKVIEENIGGAALASGDTTRGAFANMRASISRFGVALLGDGLGAAKTFFSEVTVIFDGLTDRVGPWVEKFQDKLGGMFQIEGMGDRFLGWLDRTIDSIASGPIPQLLAALQPILPALAEMASLVGAALGDAFYELGKALAPVLPMLAETLADAVVQLAPPLTDLLVALIPLVPPLVELLAAVIPLAAGLVELLIPAVAWLVELVAKAIEPISAFFDLLSGKSSFEEFMSSLNEIADAPGTALRVWLDNVAVLQGIWESIVSGVNWVRDMFVAGFTVIKDFFASTWETIGLVLGGALQVIWGLVTGNMDLVRGGIEQGLNAIRDWWTNTWNGIVSFFGGIWSSITGAVSNGISNVVSFMQSLPNRILSAVAALPGLLVNVGRQMIQGLIDGVSGMIQRAVQAVKNVGGAMMDGIKSFLGIASPSRRFRDEVGKMVGLGLLEGIGDQAIQSRIDSQVRHLVEVPSIAGVTSTQAGPSVFHLYDSDGQLIGTLKGLVDRAFSGVSSERLQSAGLGF